MYSLPNLKLAKVVVWHCCDAMFVPHIVHLNYPLVLSTLDIIPDFQLLRPIEGHSS
jgi:hypothetical protein